MFLSLTFLLLQAVQFLLHTEPSLWFTVSALVCARDNQLYGALPAVVLRPRGPVSREPLSRPATGTVVLRAHYRPP